MIFGSLPLNLNSLGSSLLPLVLRARDGFAACSVSPLESGRAFSSLTGSRPFVAVGFLVEKGFLKGGMLYTSIEGIVYKYVPNPTGLLLLLHS